MHTLKQIFLALSVLALAPAHASAQSYAYVANANSNNISAYTVNPATGALTAVPGSPFAAGSFPISLAVEPTGKFVYVANNGSDNISAYTIDSATGALTAVPGSPFATGKFPVAVAVDPTGKFAYVAIPFPDNVSAYTIDSATGALTAVPGAPVAADPDPVSVTVDPTGKFVYAATGNSSNVAAYSIDAATGALTAVPGSPFPAGLNPGSVTVDPTGKFVYVANTNSANVSAYTITPATGALSAVAGSPFPAGALAIYVSVDPTGKFAYVANLLSNNISAYTIDPATGALSAVPGSPFAAGKFPHSVAVDPTGKFVYVVNRQTAPAGGGDGNISTYTVNPATGALTAIPGSPFAAGTNSLSIAIIAVPSDNTPPTTTAISSPGPNIYGWNNTDVTVNLNATDSPGGSGVKQIQFALGGAQNTDLQTEAGHAASVTISAEGTTILGYFATDNAGNQESAKTLTVRIDKTPPVISGLPAADCSIWPPNHKLVQVASVVASDALSGIAPGSFTVSGISNDPADGSIVISGGPNRFKVQLGADKDLIYTLTAKAMDLAGNTTTSTATCSVPHDQGR